MESFNRTSEDLLAKLVKENQKDWDQHVSKVLFAYRTALHESTGYSPYRVNFGLLPKLPIDVIRGRASLSGEKEEKEIPKFVQDVNRSKNKETVFIVAWPLHDN